MTLYQLEVFTIVAKLRSFTQAAAKLRVRQPSVSLLVQALQRELKVKLFERLGNKILLTRAGEELFRQAKDILAKVERVKERLDEIAGLKKGKIAIGGSGLATASFLAVAIQRFEKEHAEIEVLLTIQRSDILEKKLLQGELDLAVLGRAPQSSLLVIKPYRDEEIVVIAPPDHPLTKKRFVPLKVIANGALITHEEGTLIRDMVEQSFVERRIPFKPLVEIKFQWGSRDAIRSMVASGLGISLLAKCHAVSDIEAGRLKVLKVPDLQLERTMYIAVHKKRERSFLVKPFIAFLREYKDQ
ncbi:MAG: LysR family transcriptional regulator [Deltaproteobacteria bacterium]|nr:LysR family transcriptional regulator [Deltaproteobacteria bacterium]